MNDYLGSFTKEYTVNIHAQEQLGKVVGQDLAVAIMKMRAEAGGELKMSIGKVNFDNPKWEMPVVDLQDKNVVKLGFIEQREQQGLATELQLTSRKNGLETKLVVYSLKKEKGRYKSAKEIQSWQGSDALTKWQQAFEFLVTKGREKRRELVLRENLVPQVEVLQVFQKLAS